MIIFMTVTCEMYHGTVGPQLSEHIAMCHFNVKGVQISEFVRISALSNKIHYLAS